MFNILFNWLKSKNNKNKDYDDYMNVIIGLQKLFKDYRQKNNYGHYPNTLKIPVKDYYRYIATMNTIITPKSMYDVIKENCIACTNNEDFKIISDDKIKKMRLDNL